MKKLSLFISLTTCFSGLFAQTINDSAVLGAGYANDVYYSMKNGKVTTEDGTNWHIAFSTRNTLPPNNVLRSVSIIANEGRGVRVYEAPSGIDVSDWNTFDTTGYMTWNNPHNSDSTWDIGPFNVNRSVADPFDFGWGSYDLGSHDVYGSKLYLVKITTGSGPSAVSVFKKLTIESLIFDTLWNFSYASLDNSDSTHKSISKRNYTNKLFAYQNLNTNTTYDREPSAPWDLLFTRYGTSVTQFNQTIFSATTGVLSHPSVLTSKVDGAATDDLQPGTFVSNITNIGTDWKINPGPGQPLFVMKDSLAYFTKRADGHTDKIVFTGLTTSASGVVSFKRTNLILGTGVNDPGTIGTVLMYPNPASASVTVELTDAKTYTIIIYDITGKSHLSLAGKGSQTLDISSLKSGVYFVTIENNGAKKTAKLIVQ